MYECKNNSCGEYDSNKPFNCAEGQFTFTICTLKNQKEPVAEVPCSVGLYLPHEERRIKWL